MNCSQQIAEFSKKLVGLYEYAKSYALYQLISHKPGILTDEDRVLDKDKKGSWIRLCQYKEVLLAY